MWHSFIAVFVGGGVGSLLRWILSVQLNHLMPNFSVGTLMANLMGGFVIGVAMAYFLQHPVVSPAWKLLIITGLCGGLTTFSSFSAEVLLLLQQGKILWALATMTMHLLGSIILTALGYYAYLYWDKLS